MYTPPAFRDDDRDGLVALMRAAPFASLVTATAEGVECTPLPLWLDAEEGPLGTLYGHVARANPHWRVEAVGETLAIFSGPDAYVSPGWYATKQETGKVVPTWNYQTVHARGPVEFFDDPERLLTVVTRLTDAHEAGRATPWAVSDAPEAFIRGQLRGIVGLRLPIAGLEGKRKMSQNRTLADRQGVAAGLAGSEAPEDRAVGQLVPILP